MGISVKIVLAFAHKLKGLINIDQLKPPHGL